MIFKRSYLQKSFIVKSFKCEAAIWHCQWKKYQIEYFIQYKKQVFTILHIVVYKVPES